MKLRIFKLPYIDKHIGSHENAQAWQLIAFELSTVGVCFSEIEFEIVVHYIINHLCTVVVTLIWLSFGNASTVRSAISFLAFLYIILKVGFFTVSSCLLVVLADFDLDRDFNFNFRLGKLDSNSCIVGCGGLMLTQLEMSWNNLLMLFWSWFLLSPGCCVDSCCIWVEDLYTAIDLVAGWLTQLNSYVD